MRRPTVWMAGLVLVCCATVGGPPSFRIAEVEPVTAYTRSEAVFVGRATDAGILVAGNFYSLSLPDRAFAQLLSPDGGKSQPLLIHGTDGFLGTHAFTADVVEQEFVLAGAADSADSPRTTSAAWYESSDFPRRQTFVDQPKPSVPAQEGWTRISGAVYRATFRGQPMGPFAVCVAGQFESDAGTGAFFVQNFLPWAGPYADGSALDVSANALAFVKDRCIAVGRFEGSAVSLDLETLPHIEQFARGPPVEPKALVRVGREGRKSDALAINSAGDIVGWEAPERGSSEELPAIRVSGKDAYFRLLPLPPGWRSGRALASMRSGAGQVFAVGWGIDENARKRALLWTEGGEVFALDTRVSGLDAGWELQEATSIDSRLDIVGNGRLGEGGRAFLLTLGTSH
jgi:hypothetical protein